MSASKLRQETPRAAVPCAPSCLLHAFPLSVGGLPKKGEKKKNQAGSVTGPFFPRFPLTHGIRGGWARLPLSGFGRRCHTGMGFSRAHNMPPARHGSGIWTQQPPGIRIHPITIPKSAAKPIVGMPKITCAPKHLCGSLHRHDFVHWLPQRRLCSVCCNPMSCCGIFMQARAGWAQNTGAALQRTLPPCLFLSFSRHHPVSHLDHKKKFFLFLLPPAACHACPRAAL